MTRGGGRIWFSAAELAELRLPGLPGVKRKINELAKARDWALATNDAGAPLARKRQGRGGGLEYHSELLPPSARIELIKRGIAAPNADASAIADVAPTPVAQLWAWYERQSDEVKVEAERRAAAIARFEALAASGTTRTAAVAVAAAQAGCSTATFWGWKALVDGVPALDRLPRLAPQRRGGGRSAEIDEQVWQLFKSDYLRAGEPTLSSCYRRAQAFAAGLGIDIPHVKTFQRRLERDVDPRVVIALRKGEEALRRTLPPQKRSVADLQAMSMVNIDGHKWDVFVRWPDGRVSRPMMVAIQDVYSRKILSWRLGESESALLTRLAFSDLFAKFGIPGECLMDNGRAFASKWITGGAKSRFRFKIREEEPTGILTALDIGIRWATPYRGQSKPIERAFRDLASDVAKLPHVQGAYTGNRPDAKPEDYATRAIDIAEFRQIVAAGIAAHNARLGRTSEMAKAKGQSFDQVFDESYARAAIRKASPEHLRMALLTADDVTVNRQDGVITLMDNRYWSAELGKLAGKRVTVRFDPDDLHRELHVYDRAGAYLGAAPLLAATGFVDAAAARERKQQERAYRKAVKAQIEAQNLLTAAELAAKMPMAAADELPPEPRIIRPVRHRGQTAAALKPVSHFEPVANDGPAPVSFLDNFAAGTGRLRVVE